MDREVVLALCGDVMTGRGVDQVLAHPGDAALREQRITDARRYVQLAEAVNGSIPRPVDPRWPWGDSLAVLDAAQPHVRVVNVETSITTSSSFWPGKGRALPDEPDESTVPVSSATGRLRPREQPRPRLRRPKG